MKIGIDMDGVLVNTTPSLIKQANLACKLKLTMDDIVAPSIVDVAWDKMKTKRKKEMGVRKPRDLYSWICPPGFFEKLEPFEGAIQAVIEMSREHEIFIITKPLEWTDCTYGKEIWLKESFKYIDYGLIMTDSMETKGIIGVDVMIDDDIRVINACELAIPIMVKQPWNKTYLKDLQARAIDSLSDAPAMIKEIDQELYK